jgi:hypothetical protein
VTETSDKPRFAIEPCLSKVSRYDHRNPTGLRRDGWWLIDTLTTASRRYDTKALVKREIENTLADEAKIDWSQVASWQTNGIYHGSGLAEVYALDRKGKRGAKLCLVGGRHTDTIAEIGPRVEAWLVSVGHPGLPGTVKKSR